MAKININKPTGSEVLSLLSAFKIENLTYVIFDSEKVGSMGLPIIYISKLTEKLEKVTDDNEWQSVKNSLKGIINGTNYEYVKVADTINADEAFYTPLTLPQSSFDLIKNRYVVTGSDEGEAKVLEATSVAQTPIEEVSSIAEENVVAPTTVNPISDMPATTVAPVANETVNEQPNVPDIAPVMPTVNAESNVSFVATPNVMPEATSIPAPSIEQTPVAPTSQVPQPNEVGNVVEEKAEVPIVKIDTNIFMQDKETFLKACENMFDALVSKYQKQLEDLERREEALKSKEVEVENKLNDASEALANAAAREQVANIAHDNAQKVMDLNNLMPSNPTTN